jgi:hypothetical protein
VYIQLEHLQPNSHSGVSRPAVSKVMMATCHAKTSAKNSGQKPKVSGRDCHKMKNIVSKNHKSTAARVTAKGKAIPL